MALLSSSPAASCAFLRISPCFRTGVQRNRWFSRSVPKNNLLVDLAISPPCAIMDAIHSTGIPWYATLPVTAAVVRGTFVYYFSARPARKAHVAGTQVSPLLSAGMIVQNSKHTYQLMVGQARPLPLRLQRLRFAMQAATRSLWLRWKLGLRGGVRRFLINFGTLITFAEAIRIKCGTRHGILGMILEAVDFSKSPPEQSDTPVLPSSAAEKLAQRLEKARDMQAEGNPSMQIEQISHLNPLDGTNASSLYFDSTLKMEGLSWCTDLTLADPTSTLPVVFGVTFALTILLRSTSAQDMKRKNARSNFTSPHSELKSRPAETPLLPSPRSHFFDRFTFGQRVGLCVSLIVPLLTYKIPAAVLLYLIPSIAIGWLQNRWLEYRFPSCEAIKACSRKVRLKVASKDWDS